MPDPKKVIDVITESVVKTFTGSIGISPEDIGKKLADLGLSGIDDIAGKVFGGELDVKDLLDDILPDFNPDDISVKLREIIYDVLDNATVRELSEVLGVAFTAPYITILESYAEKDDVSAEEFSAAFHGATMLITLPSILAETFRGNIVGQVLGPVGEALKTVYWNLGLGFLGWQTLAPLLSAGLQPKMTKHYNKLYQPNEFTLDQYTYLYHIGEITAGDLLNKGRELGWSADKVQTLINIGYRSLTRSDMADLYRAGKISVAEIRDEMLKQGYNPQHISSLMDTFLKDTLDDSKLPPLANGRKAFREGLYTTAQFTSLLKSLGYGNEAIQLEIALARQDLEAEQKKLSISQIKQAFSVGEINDTEVRLFLQGEGYHQEQILILLNTWKAAKKPKILRLNAGTITSALSKGVLSVGQASARLAEIGYLPEDIQILIQTTLSGGGVSGHTLSISQIMRAYSIGVIPQDEMINRLRGRGVDNADIRIYTEIANYEPPKKLVVTDVQQAYLYGLVDNAKAIAQLIGLNYSQNDAQYLVSTWSAQRETFRLKLTPGTLILYYRQGLMTTIGLRHKLIELGFSEADAELMVKSADLAYPRELTNKEVQDLFFSGVIGPQQAIIAMQKTGLKALEAQAVVKGWQMALANIRPQPTVSQYLTAFKDGLLSQQDLVQNLRQIGYDDRAIAFYIQLSQQHQIETTKELTKADVLGLYADELMTYEGALERLIKMGYSPEDSELLITRKVPKIEDSQVHKLFIAGYINPEDYIDILFGLGYSVEMIEDYLTQLGY